MRPPDRAACGDALAHGLESVNPALRQTMYIDSYLAISSCRSRNPAAIPRLFGLAPQYCLDLLFLGLLGFAISFLLALGHFDLPWLDEDAVIAAELHIVA
jgi:hypothetical protein